ncbi:hypothetical protein SAMN05444580_103437 [Rhodococcus tukisamuensis]|uniref:Uncharacterized protein n=1 Tax=Rhodococcus tukisamuensis TaxID=168276 RepID=A0A1G6T8N1_9NOCA|nr:hypothetical protein SAMN05444580_103437 [Rhodococcus tukisamuensis]
MTTAWIQVLVTMVDGPTTPVDGIVRTHHNSDEPIKVPTISYGEKPVVVGLDPDGVRVIRAGRKTRVEALTGELVFLTDGETAWHFHDDPSRPRRTPLERVHIAGPGKQLLITPPTGHWVRGNYARPTRPVEDVEFLGRPCWSVELAPRRPDKPSVRLIVDADSGAVLAEHTGDGIDGAAFEQATFGAPADPAVFTWNGPIETDDDSRGKMVAAAETRRRQTYDWFRENVSAADLHVPVLHDLTPQWIRIDDEATGAFSAGFGGGEGDGYMARRPRSSEPWNLAWYGEAAAAWSTADFDWACHVFRGTLHPEGLSLLQRRLHPNDPVVGQPDVRRPEPNRR